MLTGKKKPQLNLFSRLKTGNAAPTYKINHKRGKTDKQISEMKRIKRHLKMDRSVMMFIIVLTTTYFSPYDFGQDTGRSEKKPIIYTGIVNIVPDQFNFPLIGFINLANGSHNSSHIGFINVNEKDFTGVQLSFVNTVGGEVKGTQIGFVNVCDDPLTGLQLGFVNVAGKRTQGAQIGFVNTTSSIKGFQLGFVNVTDTLDKGIPLGFVSIVKEGGYRALEPPFFPVYRYEIDESNDLIIGLRIALRYNLSD